MFNFSTKPPIMDAVIKEKFYFPDDLLGLGLKLLSSSNLHTTKSETKHWQNTIYSNKLEKSTISRCSVYLVHSTSNGPITPHQRQPIYRTVTCQTRMTLSE
jgi:hypothetical protein